MKKEKISSLVDRKKEFLCMLSDAIWDNPEQGFKEKESSGILIRALLDEGFEVERGLAGIPTAFKGSFGEGTPVIGFLGEFDALPDLSQESGTAFRKELEKGKYGHGCGHNALGVGSLGAAIALKDYLLQSGKKGTVVYFGCPGEEFGCGKSFMAREGCFDHLDFALGWHPYYYTAVSNYNTLAIISAYFDFTGKASHVSFSPHLGRNALSAAELMNIGVNFMREQMIPEAKVHYAYANAGGIYANVIQSSARLYYEIRAPRLDQAQEIYQRLIRIAEGAAMMTDTKLEVRVKDGLSDFVPNEILTDSLRETMKELDGVPFTDMDKKKAELFYQTLSEEEKSSALAEICRLGAKREDYEGQCLFSRIVDSPKEPYLFPVSTDVGDVSHVVPTAQFMVSACSAGTGIHTWQMTAQGKSEISHKALLYAGKVMALTAAGLIETPDKIQAAKKEFIENTGGVYHCPFPKEVKPELE